MAFLNLFNKPSDNKKMLFSKYQSIHLSKNVSAVASDYSRESLLLSRWSNAISIGSCIAIAACGFIRSWQGSLAIQIMAGAALLAWAWSYFLSRASRKGKLLSHSLKILWVNTVFLAVFVSSLLVVTGVSSSPLFWAYAVIIAACVFQNHRMGAFCAWLSWAFFSLLILAHSMGFIPEEICAEKWNPNLGQAGSGLYPIGISLWYLVIAAGLSVFSRWIGHRENEIAKEKEEVKSKQQAIEEDKKKIQTQQQELSQRFFQSEQSKRLFDAERKRWEQEYQQWQLKKAQENQSIVDKQASLANEQKQQVSLQSSLEESKKQLDQERQSWEKERLRCTKMLDEREASINERSHQLDEEKKSFDSSRAQATESLRRLESSLMGSLKKASDEMSGLQRKKDELESRNKELSDKESAWAGERDRLMRELDEAKKSLAKGLLELDERSIKLKETEDLVLKRRFELDAELAGRNRIIEDEQKRIEQAFTDLEKQKQEWKVFKEQEESALAQQAKGIEYKQKELDNVADNLVRKQRDVEAELILKERSIEAKERELSILKESCNRAQEELGKERNALQAKLLKEEEEILNRSESLKEHEIEIDEQSKEIAKTKAQLSYSQQKAEESLKEIEKSRKAFDLEQERLEEKKKRLEAAISEHERHNSKQLEELNSREIKIRELQQGLSEKEKRLNKELRDLENTRLRLEKDKEGSGRHVFMPKGILNAQARKVLLSFSHRLREQAREQASRQKEIDALRLRVEREAGSIRQREDALNDFKAQLDSAKSDLEMSRKNREAELEAIAKDLKKRQEEFELYKRSFQKEEDKKRTLFDQGIAAKSQHLNDLNSKRLEAEKQDMQKLISARENALIEKERSLETEKEKFLRLKEEWQKQHVSEKVLLEREEKELVGKSQTIDKLNIQLRSLKEELEDAQDKLHKKEQELMSASSQREDAVSKRLNEVQSLHKQLEAERLELERQKSQLQEARQQILNEQRQVESVRQQLNEARRMLSEASMSRPVDNTSSEWLSLVANELNAPLAGMSALLSACLDGDQGAVSAELKDSLHDVMKESNKLRRVVGDALDLAKIERNEFTVTLSQIRIGDLLRQSEDEIRPVLENKGLFLKRLGEDEHIVNTDVKQAKRIIGIMLRNALENTQQGGITIACSSQQDKLMVTVTDTGVGLKPENLSQVFAKPSVGTLINGKGFGLYLAKILARSIQADVMLVNSELGHGSTFAMSFPLEVNRSAGNKPSDSSEAYLNR